MSTSLSNRMRRIWFYLDAEVLVGWFWHLGNTPPRSTVSNGRPRTRTVVCGCWIRGTHRVMVVVMMIVTKMVE